MTKSDISYSSIHPPISYPGQQQESSPPPYVEGFVVGNSHAVTVIVDENDNTTDRASQEQYYRDTNNHNAVQFDGCRKPIELNMCPKCSQAHIRTRTKTYPSALTWVSVFVGAAIFLPLCWIPLVVDPLKQTDHYCQSCGNKIGTIKPLEGCFVKEQM